MNRKEIYNLADNFVKGMYNSIGLLYKSHPFSTSDLGLKLMNKVKYSKLVKEGLNSFYEQDGFSFYYKHEKDIHLEGTIKIKNSRLQEMVDDQISFLTDFSGHLFNKTINKYRNASNIRLEDGYIVYDYIDIMGNDKTKKETILSFLNYQSDIMVSPEQCMPEVDIKICVSNRLEEKAELLEHHGFNGSCQHPGNSDSYARGYHDMYYNGGMCVIKMHQGNTFVGRTFARILYNKEGKEFLLLDRIYREGLISSMGSKIYEVLTDFLHAQGLNILLPEVFVNGDRKMYITKGIEISKEVYVGHARKVYTKKPYSYYNNIPLSVIITKDNYAFDMFDGQRYNLYIYKK